MSSRFVILHHTVHGGEHWDLMLEHGDVLLTWQLFSDPTASPVFPLRARRIGDHRKRYLDYEGPISGDRGHVTRVDHGVVEIAEIEELAVSRVRFRLLGRRLTGAFELHKTDEDETERSETDEGETERGWILCHS